MRLVLVLISALSTGANAAEPYAPPVGQDYLIGSTDTHTGIATADEDNFWGKMGARTQPHSIGSPSLATTWKDPDFDPNEAAFYYVRVIQIPTPRWTTYAAKFYDLDEIQHTPPAVIQDRAYSSPIWYTPQGS